MTANRPTSLQELQDLQGFVVIGYLKEESLQKDDLSGRMDTSDCDGWFLNLQPCPAMVAAATRAEWEAQCRLLGEDPNNGLYIAYRKVIME